MEPQVNFFVTSIRFDFDLENCAPYELPKRIRIGKIRLNRMFNQRLYLALCLLEHSSRKNRTI